MADLTNLEEVTGLAMAQTAGGKVTGLEELIEWALPIQERHLQDVLQGSQQLAAEEDPNEPA
jgi:hypothetical protein